MRRYLIGMTLALAAAGTIAGCSERPDKKIGRVQNGLDNLSERYHTAEIKVFADLMELKDRCKGEVEAQDFRFPLFRSYERSNRLLDSLLYRIEHFDTLSSPSLEPRLKW